MKNFAKKCLVIGLMLLGKLVVGQQQPPTPQLLSLYPAGAQAGEKTIVKILEQTELEFADELIFSHPGITCAPKMRETNRFFPKATPERNSFLISVAPDVPPGVYDVRAKCEYGISNPRRFVISDQDEILETEPNDKFSAATSLPSGAIANGTFEAGYDCFQVPVKGGQSLVFRCIAEGIDSKGDPVIALFDSNHRLIAKNHDTAGKDALVTYKPEKDETLYVRVNDLTFASQGGANTMPYRLTVSQAPWIDFVDPPVIPEQGASKVKLVGRNLNGTPSGFIKNGVELEMIETTINPKDFKTKQFAGMVLAPNQFSNHRITYRFQGKHGRSNSVLIELTDDPVSLESNARTLKQRSAVLGVFSEAGETDHYRFQAKKGDRFSLEVVSQRLGFATDALMIIERIQKDKDGAEIFRTVSTVDDFKPMTSSFRFQLDTEDPATIFEATADGDYRVSINDQFNLPPNTNGPNYYLLKFRKPEPGVELVAIPGLECGPNDNNSRPIKITPCIVRPNAGAEIQVLSYRTPGFTEPIELSVEGLPPGVKADPSIINGNENHGTIVLTGSPDLKSGFGKVKINAAYQVNGQKVMLPVAGVEITTNSVGNEPSESRLTDELVVIADSAVKFPGKIEVSKKVFQTSRGGVVEAKAKFIKNPKHQGQILQAFVHGLPRTVSKNSNTIQDNGSEVTYKIDFRQGTPAGEYTAFVRGYYEADVKRFEKKYTEAVSEQKRVVAVQQKLEAEYRKVTQDRSKFTTQISSKKQSLARLAPQIRAVNQQLTQIEKTSVAAKNALTKLKSEHDSIVAQVVSLSEMAKLEMDAAKKKSLSADMLTKTQLKSALEAKLKVAEANSKSHQTKLAAEKKKQLDLTVQEKKLKTELAALESELKSTTEAERKLAAERTLGQSVKREIDQELNLARQASQQRRRRFLVYSDPIRFSVDEYPVELSLSKTQFSIVQGASEKITLNLKRKFDYKGVVNLQLRPQGGANGWTLKSNSRFNDKQSTLETELAIQSNAKPGKFSGNLVATMRVGSTNLSLDIPIKLEVKPAPKK